MSRWISFLSWRRVQSLGEMGTMFANMLVVYPVSFPCLLQPKTCRWRENMCGRRIGRGIWNWRLRQEYCWMLRFVLWNTLDTMTLCKQQYPLSNITGKIEPGHEPILDISYVTRNKKSFYYLEIWEHLFSLRETVRMFYPIGHNYSMWFIFSKILLKIS